MLRRLHVSKATGGIGVGAVFEAVGAGETLNQAMNCCKKGCRVVIIGSSQQQVELNMLNIVFNELELVGTYVNRDEFGEAIEPLASGKLDLDQIINVQMPLLEATKAFELLADRSKLNIKAMLTND